MHSRSYLATQRPARAAVLASALLLASVWAAPAAAGDVQQILVGKVHSITGVDNPAVAAALEAHGVKVGAPAEVLLVVDDTIEGEEFSLVPPYVYQKYDGAVLELRFRVGTYEAWLDPSSGLGFNQILVGNDIPIGPYLTDAYVATCEGFDTDGILSIDEYSPGIALSLQGNSAVTSAGSDEGVVQSLQAYESVFGSFHNGPGNVQILFETKVAPGGGTPVTPQNSALARQGQLKAAAKLGSTLLKGLGKLAAAPPEKDPFGAKKAELLQTAADKFGDQFLAAITKALKKGGTAPLPASSEQQATELLMDGLISPADAVQAGADTANKADRTLRGKLLKAAASNAKARFQAYAAYAKKPDAEKLAKALAKAEATFLKAVAKALDKAAAQLVVYDGPDAAALSGEILELVETFDAQTMGL